MVYIIKKSIKGKTYFYLEHSIRRGKNVEKLTKYLGGKIPSDIETIKAKFLEEIHRDKWYGELEKIKRNFSRERRSIPRSSREKEVEKFAIKFTYNTQKIEGSTLTLHETADVLERAIAPRDKPLRDVKEAEAHMGLFQDILKSKRDLSMQTILGWHHRLFNSTRPDMAGKIRKHQVRIARSRFVPPFPAELYPMLTEFFDWYRNNRGKMHPVGLAALVHLKFVTIHPFSDGNGRISRLMMNFVLNRKDYPMLDISYSDRNSYYNALERSQIKNTDGIFLEWFLRKYVKEYKRLSKKI